MDLIAKSPDADVRVFHLPDGDFEFAIGRGSGCDIQLADSGVSRHHAVLSCESGIYYVQDAGSRAGTFLEGVQISGKTPLGVEMDVRIGRFTVILSDTVDDDSSASALVPGGAGEPPRQDSARQDAAPPRTSGPSRPAGAALQAAPASSDGDFMAEFRDAALMCDPETMALKRKLHLRILEKMNLSEDALDFTSDDTLLPRLEECLNQTLKEQRHELPSSIPYDVFRQALMDELVGYGPITPILRSPRVSEVMVNGPDCIFVESKGRLFESGVRFFDEKHLQQIIRRIVEPLGRHVDDASPMVDARLPDGSRVNAVIPPLALDGSSMTIRKFSDKKLTTDDLVGFGSMTREMALFLEEAVKSRQNIIVSGGTGSGKTTLLNVLSQFIPRGERVVTVEDSAELKLSHRNILINTLRMRPDRIIVGECRGAEALDMLQAMNTGHDGSLTTLHANTPRDALSRLENMVMMAGFELPSSAIREQICSAVNLIVQQTRLPDGSRKIVNITEVTGKEEDIITMQDIFVFKRTGFSPDGRVEGYHTATGNIPYFIEGLRESGNLSLDMGVFVPRN
jgi:pilus assembly protein CpaF